MKITSFGIMPYVNVQQNDSGETILDKGIFVDIFKELTKLLNCSYLAIGPPDKTFGALKGDGTWSGMVGQLDTKMVDLGMLLV